ncbi:ABC transporter substrate-binding protein [Arcobacteraceae bacterium]|nr:ABC transporter substrate-binding protein [Arcobacteraceae bacterium]
MRTPSIILLTIILFSSNLLANKDIEWKIALNWKSTLTPLSSPSFQIANMVKQMSEGKFIIKIDGLEKYDSSANMITQIQENEYQMVHTNSSALKEKDINTIWFTGIPLGMTMKEQYSWFYYGDGQKYMSNIYAKFNLLAFPAGDLGTQMSGWSKKEIKSISDFHGLQINTQGITSEILSMHKVILKDLPTSQINNAFLEGKLDMISGTSPSMDIKMGYHKIAPFYYTSWDKPASQTQFIVNKTAFENLPYQYKKILTTAIKLASYDLYYENFYESLQAWDKIKTDFPNIQIKSLPKEVLISLSKSKKLIFEQYSKENKLFKEIYNNQQQFIKKARRWSQLEEFSYIKSINNLDK